MSKGWQELLSRNLKMVQEKIHRACERANRNPAEVKILAASKGQGPEKIKFLFQLGVSIFGENYLQEALPKIMALHDLGIDWHFIGRLQTNKVKRVVPYFSTIHSLDRLTLAEELEKRASLLPKKVRVLIEVNIGEETTKGGILPRDLKEFAEKLINFPHLSVVGLMCLPPLTSDPQQTRKYFQRVKKLQEKLTSLFGEGFTELSMGTSSDFEIAIEEGATIVRLGTILFGPRR